MEKEVSIPKISCEHCVATIEREIGAIAGVEQVEASESDRNARIRFEAPASWEGIKAKLAEIGYPPRE